MATSPVSIGWRRLIEHLRLKFRQFIEKQHAVMGERNLAGPRMDAAADKGRHRGRMMRRAKRPPVGQRAAGEIAGDRMDERDFEQFARRQRRQDRRQPRRQHGFARAGRPVEQKIMAARRGDFERPLGAFLPFDVAQIGQMPARRCAWPDAAGAMTCVPLK